MWLLAKTDYVSMRTNKKIITEGKQYKVIKEHKRTKEYTVRNDNDKICVLSQSLFNIVD